MSAWRCEDGTAADALAHTRSAQRGIHLRMGRECNRGLTLLQEYHAVMTKTVPAAEAQAHFLELLDDVTERNVEVLVTRDGEPVAMVVPFDRLRGPMYGTIEFHGDIVESLDEKWDADE